MSHEEHKIKRSRRIHADEVKVRKQYKIAKVNGINVREPHKLAKKHATNCGKPNCALCGNPRKFFNEKTIQEKRFDQDVVNQMEPGECNV